MIDIAALQSILHFDYQTKAYQQRIMVGTFKCHDVITKNLGFKMIMKAVNELYLIFVLVN